MKALLLISILTIATGCAHKSAIVAKTYEGNISYTITREEAYGRAMEWLVQQYGVTDELIGYEDEKRGRILGHGRFLYSLELFLADPSAEWVHYPFVIDINNAQARILLKPSAPTTRNKSSDFKNQMDKHFSETTASFTNYIITGGPNATTAQW